MPRFCWMWLCPIVACRSLSQLVAAYLAKICAGPRQTSAATLRTTKHYWSSPRRWLFSQHYNTFLKLLQSHQIQVVLHLLLLLDLAQFQAAKSTAPDAAGVSPVHHLVGLTVVAFGSPHFPGIWSCLSMSFFLAEHFIYINGYNIIQKNDGVNWVPPSMTCNFSPWDHSLTDRAEHLQHADLESIVKRYLRKRHARHVRVVEGRLHLNLYWFEQNGTGW